MSLTLPERSKRLALALLVSARDTLAMVALLPGGDQRADNHLDAGLRELLRLYSGFAGEWMLEDHHGVFGHPQGLSPEACRPGEGVCDDGDGGASPPLGFDAVVETP